MKEEFALRVITQILRIFDLDLFQFKICNHLTKNGECRENKVSKAPSQVILYFPRSCHSKAENIQTISRENT